MLNLRFFKDRIPLQNAYESAITMINRSINIRRSVSFCMSGFATCSRSVDSNFRVHVQLLVDQGRHYIGFHRAVNAGDDATLLHLDTVATYRSPRRSSFFFSSDFLINKNQHPDFSSFCLNRTRSSRVDFRTCL